MQNTWIWVVVAVVLLGGGYLLWQSSATPAVVDNGGSTVLAPTPPPTPPPPTPPPTPSTPMTATVTYDGTSFSPKAVTIKKGGTVAWNNESTAEMWVASAQHPNHTMYSGTSRTAHCPDTSKTAFDQCAGGNNYAFQFDKVGTWKYHDHLNASVFGSVTVVE